MVHNCYLRRDCLSLLDHIGFDSSSPFDFPGVNFKGLPLCLGLGLEGSCHVITHLIALLLLRLAFFPHLLGFFPFLHLFSDAAVMQVSSWITPLGMSLLVNPGRQLGSVSS